MPRMFTFYSDPGHAWLAVPTELLKSVGLTKKSFSVFSYQSRGEGTVYLEEDDDAPLFLKAWIAKYGQPDIAEKFTDGDSFVRGLPPIHNMPPEEHWLRHGNSSQFAPSDADSGL